MLRELLITLAKLRELRQNQKLSRQALERRKQAKFRRLLRHAARHSPYYQRVIRERDLDIENCGPEDFPVLTKAGLVEHFDDIVTDRRVSREGLVDFLRVHERDIGRLYLGDYHVLHSSGTSGGQSYAVFSRDDWARGSARSLRNNLEIWRDSHDHKTSPHAKFRARRLRVAFYGAIGGHYAGVSMMDASRRGIGRLVSDSRLFEINDPIAKTVEQLNAFEPDYLTGYTTALRSLAEQQIRGNLRLRLEGITASGEVTSDEDKAYLEAAFECETRNLYACSEHLSMGLSIHRSSALRLCDDDLIYEFHDDHILVTNLFNYTMPLVRYRIDDVLSEPRPSAGTPYLEVSGVLGRTERVITFINEKGLPEDLNGMSLPVFYQNRVMRCQLQRTHATHFRYLIWPRHDLPTSERGRLIEEVKEQLRRILVTKGLANLTFEATLTEDLQPDPVTRKFPLIVDLAAEHGTDGL